jgi:hypothetical protein
MPLLKKNIMPESLRHSKKKLNKNHFAGSLMKAGIRYI